CGGASLAAKPRGTGRPNLSQRASSRWRRSSGNRRPRGEIPDLRYGRRSGGYLRAARARVSRSVGALWRDGAGVPNNRGTAHGGGGWRSDAGAFTFGRDAGRVGWVQAAAGARVSGDR